MTKAIDLPEEDLAIVRLILRTCLPPNSRAFVFGSRAVGGSRRYSDLDLALEGDAALGLDVLGRLSEALSYSDLPIKVDILDLRSVEPGFRAAIEPGMIALPF